MLYHPQHASPFIYRVSYCKLFQYCPPYYLFEYFRKHQIFLFVSASIYSALIIQHFPKSLWCIIWFTLAIVPVVHCSSSLPSETHAFWVTRSEVLPSMVSESGFFFCYSYGFQIININLGKPTPNRLYPYMTPQTNEFFTIECYFISNV